MDKIFYVSMSKSNVYIVSFIGDLPNIQKKFKEVETCYKPEIILAVSDKDSQDSAIEFLKNTNVNETGHRFDKLLFTTEKITNDDFPVITCEKNVLEHAAFHLGVVFFEPGCVGLDEADIGSAIKPGKSIVANYAEFTKEKYNFPKIPENVKSCFMTFQVSHANDSSLLDFVRDYLTKFIETGFPDSSRFVWSVNLKNHSVLKKLNYSSIVAFSLCD